MLEQMTMAQQACSFWSASTIIAQHGAGLTNLYFSRPGCKVIELGANGRRHYFQIARFLDLEYRHVQTSPQGEGPCFVNVQAILTAASSDSVQPGS